jgi:hypothetical protein
MDALYKLTLQNMERTLRSLCSRVPAPQRVPMSSSFVFRYIDKSIHQAIVQKLARVISGLHAARILLECGFIQEQGALHRMLDEFQEDVSFLCYGAIRNDITDLHRRYLDAFYEEEFDRPDDVASSSQNRPMIPRQKIRAYLAQIEESGVEVTRAARVDRSLSKAYSGYVHGASPHIMEMYGGNPPRFQVSGLRASPLYQDHQHDLWNYFFRGICAFGLATAAFGDEKLLESIRAFKDEFAKESGRADEIAPPAET